MTPAPKTPQGASWPTTAIRIASAKAAAYQSAAAKSMVNLQAASDGLGISALAAGAPLGRLTDNGDGAFTRAPKAASTIFSLFRRRPRALHPWLPRPYRRRPPTPIIGDVEAGGVRIRPGACPTPDRVKSR